MTQPNNSSWEFWVDRGGTFTDIVGRAPDGTLHTHKLLSESAHYSDATLQGIKTLLGLLMKDAIQPSRISAVKMGTTLGTNALLERQGVATALVVSKGFADILKIGNQTRPNIFALEIEKTLPLYKTVIEIEGRITADGTELCATQADQIRRILKTCQEKGIHSLAIALMHSWKNPSHENQVAEIARELEFTHITLSSAVCSQIKLVNRANTSVVDAYLTPLLQDYITRLQQGLGITDQRGDEEKLLFMQSHGGLISAPKFRGRDSTLSGPAGGIVGAVSTAKQAGFKKIIAFDMGGTSTDVAHYAGELERRYESEVAGISLCVPMMDIHTVAAGGGSVLSYDGMRYRVGPRSAGAFPGPACYGLGGPLTVTDANLILGRIHADFFPAVFGEDGKQPLNQKQANALFRKMSRHINAGQPRPIEEIAEGFLRVAIENMAAAIKKISVERGIDISEHALCCYGGAAGQHACQVAEQLGINTVIIHPFAGVLSALGMGLADRRILRQHALEQPLVMVNKHRLESIYQTLITKAKTQLPLSTQPITTLRRIHIRYVETDSAMELSYTPDHKQLNKQFHQQHQERFGFHHPQRALIIESLTVELVLTGEQLPAPFSDMYHARPTPRSQTQLYRNGEWLTVPLYERAALENGHQLTGPALISEKTGTTLIEPGWSAKVDSSLQLILVRTASQQDRHLQQMADEVRLEVFNCRFMAIAEQMGSTLQNTASSVNIKERLDFSCAIFNHEGNLIANAPHIPVHLGSMGECVRGLITTVKEMKKGDVFLTNSPYQGGTHLPDLTVVTPIFITKNSHPDFFLASRGHHADIGGATPGSMPPDSQHISEEGKLCHGLRIVQDGIFLDNVVMEWLQQTPWPARMPETNLADLQAQVAANQTGAQGLARLVQESGLTEVKRQMARVQDNARAAVEHVIETLEDGSSVLHMDDGSRICVAIRFDKANRKAIVDFSGTSPQHARNFNAPEAVCRAAVMYVFRCLVQDNIPLNDGCLAPLEIIIPKASLLSPSFPAAVVAGNVETSQLIVDCLFAALGKLAGSQGTMNNLTFGNETHQYYETIAGGAGAGVSFDGADAIQTHMTNSRITDPEVLESRFPVQLEEFSIRKKSGGEGHHKGGNGVYRKIRFLQPMIVSVLSNHRKVAPAGLHGGEAGKTGVNLWFDDEGREREMPSCFSINAQTGDCLAILTPGGGGFGKTSEE